jgi:hypothetical protein
LQIVLNLKKSMTKMRTKIDFPEVLLLEMMKATPQITVISKNRYVHFSADRAGSICTRGMVLRNKRSNTHDTSLYASMVDCMYTILSVRN